MHKLIVFFGTLMIIFAVSCHSQTGTPSGLSHDFDRTPPVFYAMPPALSTIDTSPAWDLSAPRLLLTGTVYQIDGRTPAPDVLLYYYHTDPAGKYSQQPGHPRNMPANQLGQTHGYIRGWVKTDETGRYQIYTTRPGAYPGRDEPAHIHLYVQEPEKSGPYYIDDYVFDDDPLLNKAKRQAMENRGGSGVLRLVKQGRLLVGERNLILGLNIPDHNGGSENRPRSGLPVGEDLSSFTPYHAWGPDQGTSVCPICKYGWYHGVLYFVGRYPDWEQIRSWLLFLEKESERRADKLKVYFVYGNDNAYKHDKRVTKLESLGRELQLKQVALTFVPSFADQSSEIHLNRIDPEVKNTFLIYKRSRVIGNFVDLRATPSNFETITNLLDESINDYFSLPKIKH